MSNTVFVRANGPLIIKGKVIVKDAKEKVLLEDSEAFLCRCGHSMNKPFCDGEHKRNAFVSDGYFSDEKTDEIVASDAPVVISVRDNAMLIAKGPMTIQSEDGKSTTTRNSAAFCRCGKSGNKPFCDGSHK